MHGNAQPSADPQATAPGAQAEEVACVARAATLQEFDAPGYLAANPDLRAAGVEPWTHYAAHGQREGRMQWVNAGAVGRLREAKLAALRFRRPPAPRAPGAPADFLTAAQRRLFRLPDQPPISSNTYGDHLIELIRASPGKRFLDVGAGLRPSCFSNVVNTEIFPWPSTDVVCVGEDLPFADEQFDYVLSFAVLEHTRRPWDVAREMCRVLRPGGQIWVDYPFLQPVHGYPHHYFNATMMGCASLFEPYCDILHHDVKLNNHPMHALVWMLQLWCKALPPAEAAQFRDMTVGALLDQEREALLAAGYSRLLDPTAAATIAAGTTLIGLRRPGAVPATAPGGTDDGMTGGAAPPPAPHSTPHSALPWPHPASG